MRFILTALIFVLVAGSFQSCVSKKKYDELVAAKEATDAALAETQSQVQTLSEEKDQLAADMAAQEARLNGEIESIRTDMNTQLTAVNEKLSMTEAELQAIKDEVNGMFSAYEDAGLSMDERDGRLFLVTEQPMNFRSSSSRLNRDQRNAIDELAETLSNNPAVRIVVTGHTDNKQFVSDAGMDNWDLSVARARAVADRLIRKGASPEQISIAGRADTDPIGDNETSEGRDENRRTEISPDVDMSGLLKAAGGQE